MSIRAILVSTDPAKRQEMFTWLLTTLHESSVYFPISYLTNKAVQRAGLPPVPFGATRYEIPFDRMRRA